MIGRAVAVAAGATMTAGMLLGAGSAAANEARGDSCNVEGNDNTVVAPNCGASIVETNEIAPPPSFPPPFFPGPIFPRPLPF